MGRSITWGFSFHELNERRRREGGDGPLVLTFSKGPASFSVPSQALVPPRPRISYKLLDEVITAWLQSDKPWNEEVIEIFMKSANLPNLGA